MLHEIFGKNVRPSGIRRDLPVWEFGRIPMTEAVTLIGQRPLAFTPSLADEAVCWRRRTRKDPGKGTGASVLPAREYFATPFPDGVPASRVRHNG